MWLMLVAIRKINSSQEVKGMKSSFLQICVFCALSILSHCINSYDGNPPTYRIFHLSCWNFCQPIFPSLSRSFPIVVSPSSVSPSTPHFLLSTNLSVVHFVPLSKLTKSWTITVSHINSCEGWLPLAITYQRDFVLQITIPSFPSIHLASPHLANLTTRIIQETVLKVLLQTRYTTFSPLLLYIQMVTLSQKEIGLVKHYLPLVNLRVRCL